MFEIDLDKCNGCGVCLDVCPTGAISMANDKAIIDQDRCQGCETCIGICLQRAIGWSPYPIIPVYHTDPVVVKVKNLPVQALPPKGRATWIKPVLGYVGTEIIPRLLDSLTTTLSQHLDAGTGARRRTNMITKNQVASRKCQTRKRQRIGWD